MFYKPLKNKTFFFELLALHEFALEFYSIILLKLKKIFFGLQSRFVRIS